MQTGILDPGHTAEQVILQASSPIPPYTSVHLPSRLAPTCTFSFRTLPHPPTPSTPTTTPFAFTPRHTPHSRPSPHPHHHPTAHPPHPLSTTHHTPVPHMCCPYVQNFRCVPPHTARASYALLILAERSLCRRWRRHSDLRHTGIGWMTRAGGRARTHGRSHSHMLHIAPALTPWSRGVRWMRLH